MGAEINQRLLYFDYLKYNLKIVVNTVTRHDVQCADILMLDISVGEIYAHYNYFAII